MSKSWPYTKHFYNCLHLNHQLRLIICGSSGSGKTHLLYRLLLEDCPIHKQPFLDYNTLVLVSPSLNQTEYQIIIKGFKNNLSRTHIYKLFELQNKVNDIEICYINY